MKNSHSNLGLAKEQEELLLNQLFYYRLALLEGGVVDVNQYIATRLSSLIKLTEAQEKFLKDQLLNPEDRLDFTESIDQLLILIEAEKHETKPNLEYLKMIEETLKQIKKVVV